MPVSLYQRLIGDTPDSTIAAPDEETIPIHGFEVVLMEILEGRRNEADAAAIWSLDAAQQASLATIVAAMNSVNGIAKKRESLSWLFRDLVLAELGYWPERYRDETAFYARLVAETGRPGRG